MFINIRLAKSVVRTGTYVCAGAMVGSTVVTIALYRAIRPEVDRVVGSCVKVINGGADRIIASVGQVNRYVVAAAAIAPYATQRQRSFAIGLQRILVDLTSEDHSQVGWYPLDALYDRQPTRPTNNGHAVSGAVRDCARKLIAAALDTAGYMRYELSPSGKDHESDGVVYHYAPSDLSKRLRNDWVTDKSAIVMIDTDYYVTNMDEFLGYGVPMVIFTFLPTAVSGVDGDTPYNIGKDSVVSYGVSGGGHWQHQLWNWCATGEFVRARAQARTLVGKVAYWVCGCLGFEKVVYQKLHHSRPWEDTPNRVVVWSVPTASHWAWIRGPSEMHARKLRRMDFACKAREGWNMVEYVKTDGTVHVSVGRAGEEASFDILKSDLEICMGLQSAQSVASRLVHMGYHDPRFAAMIGQYYRGDAKVIYEHERVMAPAEAVRVHYPQACEADKLEVNMRAYAAPIVTDFNCAPMMGRWDVMCCAIDARVETHRNNTVPPQILRGFVSDFIREVVPTGMVGTVVPLSWEEVVERLTKPSQQLGIQQILETCDMQPKKLISAFMKNEATNKNGRLIANFSDARFLAQYSRYTLSVRETILEAEHSKHWFIPGRTPRQIADMVVEYAAEVGDPIESDYTNLDGSVSEWMQRNIGMAVYNRAVHPDFRAELNSLQAFELSCPTTAMRFGFRYDSGVGVKSGSPTTCDKNTLYNAFVMYCAIRMTNPTLSSRDAYRSIGMCYGDDALFEKQYAKKLDKVARFLGLSIKVENYEPGQGLCFLARVFIDPWLTNTSVQDPLRTWRKLHYTSRDKNIPLATAAVDRLEGYLVTDGLTPVTSDYARAVIRLHGEEAAKDPKREKRASRYAEKPYWLTGTSGGLSWPQHAEDRELMMQVISNRTKLPVEVLNTYCNRIATVQSVWQMGWMDRDEPLPYSDHIDADGWVGGSEEDVVNINKQRHEHYRRFCNLSAKIAGKDSGARGADHRGRMDGSRAPGQAVAARGAGRDGTSRDVAQHSGTREAGHPEPGVKTSAVAANGGQRDKPRGPGGVPREREQRFGTAGSARGAGRGGRWGGGRGSGRHPGRHGRRAATTGARE